MGVEDKKVPFSLTNYEPSKGVPVGILAQTDFDTTVYKKGLRVYLDKFVKCPCISENGGSPLTSCKNCQGTGFIHISRKETKAVIHSLNQDTKYKEWSQEQIGTVSVTTLSEDRIAHMDRIICLDNTITYNQLIYPTKWLDPISNELENSDFLLYFPNTILSCHIFINATTDVLELIEGQDYTIKNNKFVLLNDQGIEKPQISINYEYFPSYHIIDLPHVTRVSQNTKFDKSLETVEYPWNGVGRISHYVIDRQPYNPNLI